MLLSLAPTINSRNQLGKLLADSDIPISVAAEVGTHRGDFAKTLLDSAWGGFLHCIDPWSNPPDYVEQAKFLWGNGDREEDYQYAMKLLEPHKDRVRFHRVLSAEAAGFFEDGSLGFVHLDGNHEPPYVEQDLELWWPKLQRGGILAGHDFICPNEINGGWGRYIQPAVMKFFRSWTIQLIVEPNSCPWTYYVVKL